MNEPARMLKYTFAEYIALEEKSEIKHEFLDGEIYAMSGGSPEHARICTNVSTALDNLLEGRPCMVFTANLRVRAQAADLVTYPDASVVCGPVERDPEDANTIRNPVLVIEVLSPSTQTYDRLEKFSRYRRIPSLREYLRISQDEELVEQCTRNDDGSWTVRDVRPPDDIELVSLGVKLSFARLYRNVAELKASRPPAKAKAKRKRD